ncbi:M1 family metallopeptidase [Virgibacillus phasianinus]|uniref:M1 family metallopeptidase n=1 Tax=Virgibacillus phasianinus TaxID=2017483 RepID=UPI0012FD97A5|nr:M1 family metallopeptidase [Virgibacillus phasianinus]
MHSRLTIILCSLLILLAGCTENKDSPSPQEDLEKQNQQDKVETNEPQTESITYGPEHPAYKINVTYDKKKHQISGSMSVQFVNNLDKTLKHIYFNLWPNAESFKSGGIEVDHITFNAKSATFDSRNTKLDISGLSLESGKKATINMDFTVTIPNKQHRFGWSGTHVSLGNWFPILAVYDNEGWNLDPYFAGGESFYSLTGDFDVTLRADEKETIATTGQAVGKVTSKDGMKVHHYQAKNVRDFAIVMNSKFNQSTKMVNNVQVNVFYTDEQKEYTKYMMETAKYVLPLYTKLFGKYPWSELDIVGARLNALGMEYPQLVMIGLDEELERNAIWQTTEHEIAHQWFYGVVGNNEFDEPWLDESFATFAGYVALRGGDPNFRWVRSIGKKYYHLTSPASTFMKHAADDGLQMYGDVIYDYGAKTLNELRKLLGDDAFYKGMQTYFETMKFKVATTEDFIRIMEQSSGEDLSQFFHDHRIKVSDTK